MKRFVILAVLAVVIVSGCTTQDFLFSGYKTEVRVESPDIIRISSPDIIPKKIYAHDSFDINFKIENIHENRDVENVSVWIENWNPCELNAINGNSVKKGESFYPGLEDVVAKLPSQSELPVSLTLTAKTNSPDLPGKCNIIYRVNYSFEAITVYSGISVMNADVYRSLIKSGEMPTEKPVEDIGTGPVRIVFDTKQKFPLEALDNRQIVMTMKIKNIGSGLIRNTKKGDIPPGSIELKVPRSFLFLNNKGDLLKNPCDSFGNVSTSSATGYVIAGTENGENNCVDGTDCSGVEESQGQENEESGNEGESEEEKAIAEEEYITFVNNKSIPMTGKGEFRTLKCVFKVPTDVPYEKTYYIQANYKYEYEIRDSIVVDVDVQ